MSDEQLTFPEWQSPLQELLMEFDRDRLREKLQKVETLIFERIQTTAQSSHHRNERESLDQAVFILRMIKRDRLGYPDWQ